MTRIDETMDHIKVVRFINQLFKVMIKYFENKQEDLSIIAAGAAFEQWLAFEFRLAFEKARNQFSNIGIDLSEKLINNKHQYFRYWSANESTKVDFMIGERYGLTIRDKDIIEGNDGSICIEFKIIHNNKNWQCQCDRICADLNKPALKKRSSIICISKRFGIIALVTKRYPDWFPKNIYPQQRDDIKGWHKEMEKYLFEKRNRLKCINKSKLFTINESILLGKKNYIMFYLVGSTKK